MAENKIQKTTKIENDKINHLNIMTENPVQTKKNIQEQVESKVDFINCLKNETIIVRYLPKKHGMITNKKHILYGGMADNASRTFVVPKLQSGMYVNILTDSEKNYLEKVMGLPENALSVYKKENNFWDTSNVNGISSVKLYKQDNYFNLSNPEDYIKYKILLANKDFIAPSLESVKKQPKVTYQYVIIESNNDELQQGQKMDGLFKAYQSFNKYKNDFDALREIIEMIDKKHISPTNTLSFLQERVNDIIQSKQEMFLQIMNDNLFSIRILLKQCVRQGLVIQRNNEYFISEDKMRLSKNDITATFDNACIFLGQPENQDIKFKLEAQLKKK